MLVARPHTVDRYSMVVVTTVLYVYASSAHCSTCTGIGIGGIKRSLSYSLVIVVDIIIFCVFVVVASKNKDVCKSAAVWVLTE